MRHGNVTCDCGKTFYFESENAQVGCLKCGKVYETKDFPILVPVVDVQDVEEVHDEPVDEHNGSTQ